MNNSMCYNFFVNINQKGKMDTEKLVQKRHERDVNDLFLNDSELQHKDIAVGSTIYRKSGSFVVENIGINAFGYPSSLPRKIYL